MRKMIIPSRNRDQEDGVAEYTKLRTGMYAINVLGAHYRAEKVELTYHTYLVPGGPDIPCTTTRWKLYDAKGDLVIVQKGWNGAPPMVCHLSLRSAIIWAYGLEICKATTGRRELVNA